MKIKFDVREHLIKDLPIYLLLSGSLIIVTGYAIDVKNQAKDFEKFTIVSGLKFTNANTLTSIVRENEGIKEIAVASYAYNDSFFELVQSNFYVADILILPSTYEGKNVIDENLATNFVELQNDNYYDSTNLVLNDVHYGINLNRYLSLTSQFEFNNSDYYLFVMKNSVHNKHWNENAKTDIIYSVLEDYLK